MVLDVSHEVGRSDAAQGYSPRAFLKSRRPNQFSDTAHSSAHELDRSQAEYFLESLGSRSGEVQFESLCREIAWHALCPSLMPPTGPMGGGDSKVDSETIPVSDSISDNWTTGHPHPSSDERWAFAFSTQKTWKPKLRADIESLLSTGRIYKRCSGVRASLLAQAGFTGVFEANGPVASTARTDGDFERTSTRGADLAAMRWAGPIRSDTVSTRP